jgi:hypothetical protein
MIPPPLPAIPKPKAFRDKIAFNVAINVDVNRFEHWSADRIKAFFDGIAAVLSASGGTVEILTPKEDQ